MKAHVLTTDELAVRRAAAWLEYQRDHVPCSTRRQMFTGGANVTDQMARSHEMMRKLVPKLDILAKDILLASDDTAREEIRSKYKKAVYWMLGRNRYFKGYTKMATLQPAGNATAPLSSRPSAKVVPGRNPDFPASVLTEIAQVGFDFILSFILPAPTYASIN